MPQAALADVIRQSSRMIEMAMCEKNPRYVDELVGATPGIKRDLKVIQDVACLNAAAPERVNVHVFVVEFYHLQRGEKLHIHLQISFVNVDRDFALELFGL